MALVKFAIALEPKFVVLPLYFSTIRQVLQTACVSPFVETSQYFAYLGRELSKGLLERCFLDSMV